MPGLKPKLKLILVKVCEPVEVIEKPVSTWSIEPAYNVDPAITGTFPGNTSVTVAIGWPKIVCDSPSRRNINRNAHEMHLIVSSV